MRIPLTGPGKYLTAGIVFAIAGTPFFIGAVIDTFHKNSGFLIFTSGLVLFSAIMFWFWQLYLKTGNDPLSKNLPFWVGYLFSWLGSGFLQILLSASSVKDEMIMPIILSVIFIILGLPLLYVGVKNIFRPGSQNEATQLKIVDVVIWIAVIIGLSPVVILIIGIFYTGNYILGSILTAIFMFAIWGFRKIRKKKSPREMKNSNHEEI